MTTVRDIMGWLEDAYPPALAESWDRIGLDCGDPDAEVTTIGFAVDPTDSTVAEAVDRGAELLVTHHPLMLRGVTAIRFDEPKGRLVKAMLDAGLSHFCGHTNVDHAVNGASDALAAVLDLGDVVPLVPLAGTDAVGTGRVGVLPTPLTGEAVARRLSEALPRTATGIRVGGDAQRLVRRVAVVGGSGDSFLDAARAAGVDAYVTADLRHHVAQDFLAWQDAPLLIDVAHMASEWVWLPWAQRLVRERAAADGVRLDTYVSTIVTDPWTLRV